MTTQWGRTRTKKLPPSSSRPSILSSWLLRLKKMGGGNDGDQHVEFYDGDEACWRLSFRKEKVCGYETEEEEGEGMNSFSEMVSSLRSKKELQKVCTAERTPRMRKLINSSSSSSSSRRRRRRKKGITHVGEEEDAGTDCGYQRRNSVSPIRRRCRVRVGASEIHRRVKPTDSGGFDRFAFVKCSFDPASDFLDSMLEMILGMNICGRQQLEDLLSCYLSLNSDEYHHLIIQVFRQIWFHFNPKKSFGVD